MFTPLLVALDGDPQHAQVLALASHPAGEPAQVVCDYTRQHGCDLIVIGHRHLSRLERLFEPSVGRWTIGHAPCPVLVEVRDPQP